LLPTNGTDAFEEFRDPAYLFRPFTPVEADQATLLITISEVETAYSLLPIDDGNEDVVVAITIEDIEVEELAIVISLDDYAREDLFFMLTLTEANLTWVPDGWFDAGTPSSVVLYNNSSNINRWNSRVGSNLAFLNAGDMSYGVATQNSLNLMQFDGAGGIPDYMISDDETVLSDLFTGSAGTMVMAFRYPAVIPAGGRNVIYSYDDNLTVFLDAPTGPGSEQLTFIKYGEISGNGSYSTITKPISSSSRWVIATLVHGSNTLTAYVNGGASSSVSCGNNPYIAPSYTGDKIFIAGDAVYQLYLEMDLAEIRFKKAATSESEVRNLEGDIAHRWAIQSVLPSDHPYKNAPP